MENRYRHACASFLEQYIQKEVSSSTTYFGWYHYIDNLTYNTVGTIATSEMLILIKDADLPIKFDCMPMLRSLMHMQKEDGGWSYRSNILVSSTEPTALAILAIYLWRNELGVEAINVLNSGVSWLFKYKNKSNFWGPINLIDPLGYTYFTCVAINCLNRLSKEKEIILSDEISDTIEKSIDSLLRSFDNNDCGWGETVSSKSTLFHTAFVVVTLLRINIDYLTKFQIIKAVNALRESFDNPTDGGVFKKTGEFEIYQNKTHRLVYNHSVDTYLSLALLMESNGIIETQHLKNECLRLLHVAENTDWRYRDYITSWRMYDVVLFCLSYEKLTKEEVNTMTHYNIALTFAGETRPFVSKVAEHLSKTYGKKRILYDNYHEAEFARPQLDVYLQDLYHNHSDLIVIFLCPKYAQKKWCGVEWRAIRDILNNMDYKKIMYIKATTEDIDSINLPGFYASVDGFIDINGHTEKEIAELIIQRYNLLGK